ncbi:S8 family serine peptidase [Halomicrobium sp. HM KBTZ05]|uniref:S8 family serine peptidase n=1 Tax=Halomicrobium sp. HM KBTZ05 TaxID=3242663 RepID=UPI003557B352
MKSIGALGALAGVGVTGATPGRSPGPKPDELIVGAKRGVSTADVESEVSAATTANTSVVHRNEALGYLAVKLPEVSTQSERESVRQQFESQPNVAYVEDNVTYETQLTPNDPRFGDQYAPQQVNAAAAWDTTLGSTDVTVAIVDTGTQYEHPDLTNLFGSNPGRDFVDGDGDPAPGSASESHGTHVSGCASADTDNGVGVAGVSDSRLLSARALGGGGGGALSDIADAVRWATDQGVDIINMSLGGGGYTQTLKRAVEYAYDQNDVLVVCAAGNDGGSVSYPAAYDECVAVSALDPNEELANFSNRGPEIEVAAPGVNVLSTVPYDGYDSFSGTSMASPVAAGVAALGKAAEPGLSASQLRERLKSTADGVGLPGDQQGSGRVDAADIVRASGDPPDNETPSAAAAADPTDPSVGETVTFDGSASSDPDGTIESYQWDFGDGNTGSGVTVEHSYDAADEYQATLTVTDDSGASTTDGVVVNVSRGGGGDCSQSASGSADGQLTGWRDSDSYTWTSQFSSTCDVTVDLSGPSGTDFDLYVTADGRTPTTNDYDARSVSGDSEESVTLSEIGDSVGILVDSYRGSGSYTVSVEETGAGTRATTSSEGL